MMVEVVDPLKEGVDKENTVELEGNKEVKECVVSLEVKHIVLCVHSSSFFEDSAKYILQPQVHNPILQKLLLKETTWVPFDPPFVLIPWDPGGKPFDKLLACNFKPP
jgi:hypothetical protein